MTDQNDIVRDPEPSSDERDEDVDLDERTSPTPYAEDFSAWVAEETAAPDDI